MDKLVEQFKELIADREELPEGLHYEVWDESKLLFEVPEKTIVLVVCKDQ